jgi:hypothetical protein
MERKETKYQSLLDDLRSNNNAWTFDLHVTAIGYLTSTDELHLNTLYDRLDIQPQHCDNITRHLVCTTARAFAKMARERLASMQTLPTSLKENPSIRHKTKHSHTTATKPHRKHTKKRKPHNGA